MAAIVEQKYCRKCGTLFAIDESDDAFYGRIDVPRPTCCPECRSQRRMAETNQIYLFKRTCEATKKPIVSNVPESSPYTVYSQEYWYGEHFDAGMNGRPYDFSRPFFDQYGELLRAVPRPALVTNYLKDENCAYTNYSGKNKDCYLIFDSDEDRDCYYGYGVNSSVNAVDCYRAEKVELCYETVDARNCYRCSYTFNCENCSNSAFLKNCTGCKNCFMCSNMLQKEYYVRNQPSDPATVQALMQELQSFERTQERLREFIAYQQGFPQKYLHGFQNEEVSGDYLTNCKNVYESYDCRHLWDGKYCVQVFMPAKDVMDVDEVGLGELAYQSVESGYNSYNIRFCASCYEQISNLTYCNFCITGSSDCFGCVGLRRKQYCVLNKQYSKAEYEELVPRITAHMRQTGEWGEFFSRVAGCVAV